MRSIRTTAWAILLSMMAVAHAGCDDDPMGADRFFHVRVTLTNVHSQAIHILGPGEDPGPANRLSGMQYRMVTVDYDAASAGVLFRAGRDGQVIPGAAVVCSSRDPKRLSAPGIAASVSWDGNRLTCDFWDVLFGDR